MQPAFLVNATKERRPYQGQWWPMLPYEQLHDEEGRELLLADFSLGGNHILGHMAKDLGHDDIVVVDAGYSDMLMLERPAAAGPPGFERYHVVKLITRQDAAAMLGMPSLCTECRTQPAMPVVQTLYALP